ncbi:MAG: hypothetical protein QM759_17020 [Terricaulis sp.]
MTKLEAVLERIRQLPPDQQDYFAIELEFMLAHPGEAPQLTPEQDAELVRRLTDPDRRYLSHSDVESYFEKKYGA